jgi:hypothetical protein
MNETTPIVSGIHAAIISVKGKIKRLEKAGENLFDKYHFTSIDDFKDLIRPLLAENGLYMSISETGFETVLQKNNKGDEKTQCKIGFEIWLTYKDGSETKPVKSTVMLPYTGAQTAGIAESYAIKNWGKSQLLASSGDTGEEADTRKQDEYSETDVLSKKDATPLYAALQKEMREIALERNSDAMLKWASDNRSLYMSLPPDWRDSIKTEYAETVATIKATEKMDGKK